MTALLVVLAAAVVLALGWWALRATRPLGTPIERATFATLHTASLAGPPLRDGLTVAGAEKSVRHLRELLGTPAVALTDGQRLLAWDGAAADHGHRVSEHAEQVVAGAGTQVLGRGQVACGVAGCTLRVGVMAPLIVDGSVVGTLGVYGPAARAGLVRAVNETARWVSSQLELAELDASRTRMVEAELRALRAQISPHFVYNALSAIASFVRTDPERARELLVEFADFTRYTFRRQGDYTTLAAELASVERYLSLEHARFGERLQVSLQIAPEVLGVSLPFLCVQPLVENAVRHGLEGRDGPGEISIEARDMGSEAVISVEDDGVGSDPEVIARALAGRASDGASVGLGNVDARLRQVYGRDHGLVVETAPGAGTRVSMRIPKYQAGVRA